MAPITTTGAKGREPGSARWWAGKGGAGLIDQGLYSMSGFAVAILAARSLEPHQYGAFVVAYSACLLLASVHTALVTEPLMVLGAGRYAGRFRRYMGVLLRAHVVLTGAGAILLAAAALVAALAGSRPLSETLAAGAVAAPGMLLWWMVRRAFYARLLPGRAAAGSGLVLVLAVSSVVLLGKWALLSAPLILLVLGGVGLAVGGGMLALAPPYRDQGQEPVDRLEVLADHWRYGRWNILATAFYWCSGQLPILVVSTFLGLSTTGMLAAVANLFRPLNVMVQSAALLVISGLSSLRWDRSGNAEGTRESDAAALAVAASAIVYGATVTACSGVLFGLLYQDRYQPYSTLVLLVALVHVASAVLQVLGAALKSARRTKAVAEVWGVSALLVAVLAVPAVLTGGLVGVMSLVAFAYAVAAILAWRRTRRSDAVPGWEGAR